MLSSPGNLLFYSSDGNLIKLKLAELRPGMEQVTLHVRIINLEEVREITTSYGFTHRILDGEIEDETRKMELTVWNEMIENFNDFKIGDAVTLDNCFITSYKGVLSVNVGRESDARIDG